MVLILGTGIEIFLFGGIFVLPSSSSFFSKEKIPATVRVTLIIVIVNGFGGGMESGGFFFLFLDFPKSQLNFKFRNHISTL